MSKSRLFVFQLKEIIYTFVFVILAIILIVVLINMFKGDKITPTSSTSSSYSTQNKNNILSSNQKTTYVPGIYATNIDLNNQRINLQVTVDKNQIKSVSATNLSDTIEVMYPLLEPSIEYIEHELAKGKSIEDIEYDSSTIYTGTMLTEAITSLLSEAKAN